MFLADPTERAVIEKAQQFSLHARRHFADFIQQHRAATGLLEEAFFTFMGVGVSARRVAKQLAFHHIFRNRRAVERQIGLIGARACQMTGVGQQIFTGTGISGDKQRRIQHRQFARLIHHLLHARADRDDMTEGVQIETGQVLKLAAHAHRGAQHRDRAGQDAGAALFFQMHRRNFQHKILAVNHYVLGVRLHWAALQPALEIKTTDKACGVMVAQARFILAE
ncbi:hypothetical protein BN132_741 [Cronobacter turicensis 564]|nr:hypothetical protein BN132_741 [Cronobacter turicensis 564]